MTGEPYSKERQLARGTRRYRRKVASPKQWQAIIAAKGRTCRLAPGCAYHIVQFHHIVSRAEGGDDVADNIAPLCAWHHMALTRCSHSTSEAIVDELVTPTLTAEEALDALNALRSNIIGTQNASWSNAVYPLVAILNAAGLELFDPSDDALRQHLACYGGAGGYPGNELSEPQPGWCEPTSRLQLVVEGVRRFLADPTDENRDVMEARLPDA